LEGRGAWNRGFQIQGRSKTVKLPFAGLPTNPMAVEATIVKIIKISYFQGIPPYYLIGHLTLCRIWNNKYKLASEPSLSGGIWDPSLLINLLFIAYWDPLIYLNDASNYDQKNIRCFKFNDLL
jgi:hypothetical protein